MTKVFLDYFDFLHQNLIVLWFYDSEIVKG